MGPGLTTCIGGQSKGTLEGSLNLSTMTDLDLSVIDQQEEQCRFKQFNADVAFQLGLKLREAALKQNKPVLVQITSASGVVYFACATSSGVVPDNERWAARKRRTVLHFGRSTFYIGCKLRHEGRTIQALEVNPEEYATAGGGFPVRVEGVEGVVGVIVVSGLPQHVDHGLIYDTVKDFVK